MTESHQLSGDRRGSYLCTCGEMGLDAADGFRHIAAYVYRNDPSQESVFELTLRDDWPEFFWKWIDSSLGWRPRGTDGPA